MLAEVLAWLNIRAGGVYLDVTGGMGGHSATIVERLGPHGRLEICDCHENSVALLKKRFADAKNVCVHHGRFSLIFDNQDLPSSFDGILADFGVSSYQLEQEKTGIAFLQDDVLLDMRLDDSLPTTAADLLETLPENELADIFFHFGGERAARHLARIIAHDRKIGKAPHTTTELRQLCERTLGRFYRGKKIHPATKIFQALRISVNNELAEIDAFLKKAPARLSAGGRLVTIAFHEGEDRLVKNCFRELAETKEFFLPRRKAVKPTQDEILANPRARSAKLRMLEKQGVNYEPNFHL